MKIAIVGATGFIGQYIFDEAVARKHQVTALVRNPAKVTATTGVTAKKLELQNPHDLKAALAHQDAAVLSFHYEGQDLHSIINAVKASGVKYALFVGGAASLEVAPGVHYWIPRNFQTSGKPPHKPHVTCSWPCAASANLIGRTSHPQPL